MRVIELNCKNFRSFKDICINFDKNLTVLTSNNIGKTSLLDALAISLNSIMFDTQYMKIEDNDFRISNSDDNIPLELNITSKTFQGRYLENRIVKNLPGDYIQSDKSSKYFSPDKHYTNSEENFPVIKYYKSNRKITSDDLNMFFDTSNLRSFLPYLNQIYNDSFDLNPSYKKFFKNFPFQEKLVINIMNKFLKNFGNYEIEYSITDEKLLLCDDNKYYYFEQLNNGLQHLIALFGDILTRCYILNYNKSDNFIFQTRGCVLIDDIELYFDIPTQHIILDKLIEIFPRIQFIVSTKNPNILSTIDFRRIIKITKNAPIEDSYTYLEKLDEQIQGVDPSFITSEVLGVDNIPNINITRIYNNYTNLIDINKHNTEDGKQLRRILEQHYGKQHHYILDLDKLIRFKEFKTDRE